MRTLPIITSHTKYNLQNFAFSIQLQVTIKHHQRRFKKLECWKFQSFFWYHLHIEFGVSKNWRKNQLLSLRVSPSSLVQVASASGCASTRKSYNHQSEGSCSSALSFFLELISVIVEILPPVSAKNEVKFITQPSQMLP